MGNFSEKVFSGWFHKNFDLFTFRYKAWMKRARGKLSNAPKLANLPPTTEAFNQNVFRARTQGLIWNSCLQQNPPSMETNVNISFIWVITSKMTIQLQLSKWILCILIHSPKIKSNHFVSFSSVDGRKTTMKELSQRLPCQKMSQLFQTKCHAF